MESDFLEPYREGFLTDLEKGVARQGITDEELAITEFLNRRLSELGIRARFQEQGSRPVNRDGRSFR